MKLLKIGSSPSCDIVLNSEFVSSHHADITVLDNGELVIEDKNSTNGTYIGTKKINPNQEIPIKRGDYIRFADTDLVWARVPSPDNNKKYKQIINIGTNFRNDIVINSQSASRYHATLKIEKGGKAYIADNGSKNGTQVNGVRINGLTRIKRGDNVLCGGEDISEQIKPFLSSSIPMWGWISGISIAIAAIAAILWIIWPPTTIAPEQIRPGVVYVRAAYKYHLTVEDNPLNSDDKDLLVLESAEPMTYQATAFFIDKEGRLATNRHVAVPWEEEYRKEGETEKCQATYQTWLAEELGVPSLSHFALLGQNHSVQILQKSKLGMALINAANSWQHCLSLIRILENSRVKISGQMEYITVGYPGRNYSSALEFERCFVVEDSKTEDIDLAILQLNNMKTPEDIVNGKTKDGKEYKILSPTDIVEKTLVPLKDNYTVIGYPFGLTWGLDEKSHTLEPNIKSTHCAKAPSRYTFQFESDQYGGSSGSPIFDKKGKLVGVLCSGYEGTTVTYAVHAKYLKELYEKAVVQNPTSNN